MICYNMSTRKEQKMNILKHRFVPTISTTSKVILDKKRKMKSRLSLKKRLREEGY